MYPLVGELADGGIPVAVMCRVLGIARQPYYRWRRQPVSEAEWDRAQLANAVYDAHRDDPEFGYRFLADEVRTIGMSACDRAIWRICADNGWRSAFGKKRSRKAGRSGTPPTTTWCAASSAPTIGCG
jgi:putative transposase